MLLPLERFADHYLASLDVRGLSGRKEHPPRAVGIWDRLVEEARAWPGTTLVSHELFASATADQAARAIASFGDDTEVHVVLTARDLVRQIPAEWQEHVKHRSTKTLPDFVDDLREDVEGTSWFWRVQDFADVVDRWGRTLPASRVHVVTVPAAGADPGTLWDRFATLLGLDPASFDTKQSRANTSLGVEQAELLRRVNAELGDRVPLPGPVPGRGQERARAPDPRRPEGHATGAGRGRHGLRGPPVRRDRGAARADGGRRRGRPRRPRAGLAGHPWHGHGGGVRRAVGRRAARRERRRGGRPPRGDGRTGGRSAATRR